MSLMCRSIIWLWSVLLAGASAALSFGPLTIYPNAERWMNIGAAVLMFFLAIGFGLRKTWAVFAAIPVVLATTIIDVMLGLHGGLAVAWPGVVLGIVGCLALFAQFALRKTPASN